MGRTRRSRRITVFGTYHGASVMILRTLDWNLSRISIFEFDAVPHSCFRITLCTSSLFYNDSCDFRPRIQYSFRSWGSSCFLFVVICLRQFSQRTRCLPKYFTSSGWTRYVLFSWADGHGGRLRVKVTWVDFISLAFIRHFLSHMEYNIWMNQFQQRE